MSVNTEVNEALVEVVSQLYSTASLRILDKVKTDALENLDSWGSLKHADIQSVTDSVKALLSKDGGLAKIKISDGIVKSYLLGKRSAERDMKVAKSAISGLIPSHIEKLILDSNNLLTNAHMQITRNVEDAYRKVIDDATVGTLVGTETRLQATQDALNRFAAQGITGFVDKLGRQWQMDTYAEMATRTVAARAALQGHLDRQLELGNDLTKVSYVGATCPICMPWQGKVLSISGSDPEYASLQSAKEAGLFHPNCKHTVLAYFPEIDDGPEPIRRDPEKDAELYKATQKQRYNERMIRHHKRQGAVAITPDAKADSAAAVLHFQKKQRDLMDEHNGLLTRKYARESTYSRSGIPSKAKEFYDLDLKRGTTPSIIPGDIPDPVKKKVDVLMDEVLDLEAMTPLEEASYDWFDYEKASAMKEYSATGSISPMSASGRMWTADETEKLMFESRLLQSEASASITKHKVVYRGQVFADAGEVREKYAVGTRLELDSITASSPQKRIASIYSDIENVDPDGVGVIFEFENPRGVIGLSRDTGEVILPKGSKYRVTKEWMDKDGKIHVSLLHVGEREAALAAKMAEDAKIAEATAAATKTLDDNIDIKKVAPIVADVRDIPTLRFHADHARQFVDDLHNEGSMFTKRPESETNLTFVIADAVSKANPRIRVPGNVIEAVLKEGRFKNQFETGTSKGMLSTSHRKAATKKMFGATGLAPSDYEIYGYIQDDLYDDISEGGPAQYGSTVVTLKKEMMDRMTYTVGDSLDMCSGGYAVPSSVKNPVPSWNYRYSDYAEKLYSKSAMKRLDGEDLKITDIIQTMRQSYLEAQYHGGVTLADMDSIVFDFGTDITIEMEEIMKANNIKWGKYKDPFMGRDDVVIVWINK